MAAYKLTINQAACNLAPQRESGIACGMIEALKVGIQVVDQRVRHLSIQRRALGYWVSPIRKATGPGTEQPRTIFTHKIGSLRKQAVVWRRQCPRSF
jgi:hypothetical protein